VHALTTRLPAAQLEQATHVVEPGGAWVPGAHGTHDEAPGAELKVSAGQRVQVGAFSAVLNCPARHGEQTVSWLSVHALTMRLPAEQLEQTGQLTPASGPHQPGCPQASSKTQLPPARLVPGGQGSTGWQLEPAGQSPHVPPSEQGSQTASVPFRVTCTERSYPVAHTAHAESLAPVQVGSTAQPGIGAQAVQVPASDHVPGGHAWA